MTYQIKQTRRFARQYKKLHDNVVWDVNDAISVVAANPAVGERKKGDLTHLWVYKFRSQGQLFLLGYTVDNDFRLIYLEAVGAHENFYRDVKR